MLFAIARAAFDSQIQHLCECHSITRDGAYPLVRGHLRTMSAEWRSGEAPLIEYNDPYCRAAYVYAHSPANANLCLGVLRKLVRANALVRDNRLRMVAFGGGPGTELMALAKLFSEQEGNIDQVDVEVEIIDYTNEWSESVNAIKRAVRDRYTEQFGRKSAWPMVMETNFSRLDFLKTASFASVPSLFRCDVLVLNYVLSELKDKAPKLIAVLKDVFSQAVQPRAILVIDRRDEATKTTASQLMRALKVAHSGLVDIEGRIDSNESLSEYGNLIELIDSRPRMKSQAFWCYGGNDAASLR